MSPCLTPRVHGNGSVSPWGVEMNAVVFRDTIVTENLVNMPMFNTIKCFDNVNEDNYELGGG